jgi:hypothetical protein
MRAVAHGRLNHTDELVTAMGEIDYSAKMQSRGNILYVCNTNLFQNIALL